MMYTITEAMVGGIDSKTIFEKLEEIMGEDVTFEEVKTLNHEVYKMLENEDVNEEEFEKTNDDIDAKYPTFEI